MAGPTRRYTIGQLARLCGLSVRTIRFYADAGLVPPVERTAAGYRRFGADAVARLELVRTLRELDIDLPTIRRVLAREVSLAEVARAHAEALNAQIRILRLRRAVLRRVAEHGATPKEVDIMNQLARLSADERRRIVTEFLDAVFGGLAVDPDFEQRMRSAMPDLPDDPTPEQVDAWIELAELVRDDDFRRRIRQMAEQAAADRAAGAALSSDAAQAMARLVQERAGAAVAAGIASDSPEVAPIVAAIVQSQLAAGRADTQAFRAQLADRLAAGTDARAERYWQLLAVINGWPSWPPSVPAFEWTIAALRASLAGGVR